MFIICYQTEKNMLALWQPARSKMTAIFQNGHYFLVFFSEKG